MGSMEREWRESGEGVTEGGEGVMEGGDGTLPAMGARE